MAHKRVTGHIYTPATVQTLCYATFCPLKIQDTIIVCATTHIFQQYSESLPAYIYAQNNEMLYFQLYYSDLCYCL